MTVSRQNTGGVSVQGPEGLPTDPEKNTATAGLLALLRERKLKYGFRVSIEKGIPLSSGMGGSAASAVAGVVAANELLDDKLSNSELLRYALVGEAVASGTVHADNVAPSLLGGLVLVRSAEAQDIVQLPSPNLVCVLVHPDLQVSTREARKILKPDIALGAHVRQSSRLAGFMAGCFSGDIELIARCLEDEIIEPQRARLIRGFENVKKAALQSGAIGCSISGSGPSVFAWSKKEVADKYREPWSPHFVTPEWHKSTPGFRLCPLEVLKLWVSTRGSKTPISFSEAMTLSSPPEGGLFVPESFPKFEMSRFSSLVRESSIREIAPELLRPFFANDPLEAQLAKSALPLLIFRSLFRL